jgi:Mn2+/Fe2+ NRAMP family transporter
VTYALFVKLFGLLWGDNGERAGRFIWRAVIIFIAIIIVIRLGMDYNNIMAAIMCAGVLFMPVLMIFTAVFKDDAKEALCKFFDWEFD